MSNMTKKRITVQQIQHPTGETSFYAVYEFQGEVMGWANIVDGSEYAPLVQRAMDREQRRMVNLVTDGDVCVYTVWVQVYDLFDDVCYGEVPVRSDVLDDYMATHNFVMSSVHNCLAGYSREWVPSHGYRAFLNGEKIADSEL